MNELNVFRSSKWQVNFSNMPTLTQLQDMKIYDYYIKSCTLPSIALELTMSEFKNWRIQHPVPKGNHELNNISIEFKACESLINYYNLFDWMMEMKYGQNVPVELIRKNIIKSITIELLDNQRRVNGRLFFTNAFLIGLSSLNLIMGNDDEVSFMCDFNYEEMKLLKVE